MSDAELLQRYVQAESAAAFREIVRRHLDLVYSVARRQTRSPSLAEDVAQNVFIELARHARAIKPGTPLAAWLHVVCRRTALNAARETSRREARERAAAILTEAETMNLPSASWSSVEPLLDEAVESLDEPDRMAILLRFFENKSLREVGAALGTTDDAAQKRVVRALEQLRTFLTRRGAAVTAAGLAAELSAHAIFTAPAALAVSISAAALSVGAAASSAVVVALVQKFALAVGAAVILGLGLYAAWPRSAPRPQSGTALVAVAAAPVQAAASSTEVTFARSPAPALARAQILDERVVLLRKLLAELPAQNLPEIRLLAAADWSEIAGRHELDSVADIRLALADLRAVGRKKFAVELQEALKRFIAGSIGQLPANPAALAPYLALPADPEMLARYDLLRTGKFGDASEKFLREKPTSDMLLFVGLDGWEMKNNPDHAAGFGESDTDAIERGWASLSTALGREGKEMMAGMASPRAMKELFDQAIEAIGPIYGDADGFGSAMKEAVLKFLAANPGAEPEHLGKIVPYLKDADKFLAAMRPSIALIAYLQEHDGNLPTHPALLRPYLEKPSNHEDALRLVKLKITENSLETYFNWGNK